MKTHILFRKIHYWGSIIIAIPIVIIIGTGLFLQVKKEFDWIQPPTQNGIHTDIPQATFDAMFEAAKSVEVAEITTWADLDRFDMKPDKGTAKIVSKNRWEIQIDVNTAEILSITYRRSDLFEQIHDGSWFAEWMKLWIFLPVGAILFFMWMTGLYLFIRTEYKKWGKDRKKGFKGKS
jgi:uncharacterized iron-regulated membrane protein